MQGDREIIRALNAVLTNELTAINQYYLHARMYESWGFQFLGKVTYEESIGEMKHADKLIKRILFLNGLPNLQDLHKLKIGENVAEALAADLSIEVGGREAQAAAITLAESRADYVTREIVVGIMADTEEHIDFLETQLSLIKALGEQNYLLKAMGDIAPDDSATGGGLYGG
jgi:bacterioferritin